MTDHEKYAIAKIKRLATTVSNELASLRADVREMITEHGNPEMSGIFRRLVEIEEAARQMETA